jgi:hypothetical protein
MRYLIVLLLVASASAQMFPFPGPGMHAASGSTPISLVAHAKTAGNPPGNSSAVNTTGATLLVAGVANYSGACATGAIADSKSNTWTLLTNHPGNPPAGLCIAYVANPTVGPGHTFSGNGGFAALFVMAFSNVVTTSPIDVSTGNDTGGGVNTLNTGSVTPSVDNDVW